MCRLTRSVLTPAAGVVLVLISCSVSAAGGPVTLGTCADLPGATVERAHCLGELAAQNRDAMLCREKQLRGGKSYSGPLLETCFAAFARGTADPELCAPLGALTYSSAKSICLSQMAREEGGVSVCAGAGLCVARLAGLTGDASLCDPLEFEHRQECLYRVAVALVEFERCAEIFGDWQYSCYRDTAALLGQPEICRAVAHISHVSEACYTAVAVALLEPSVCDNVKDDRSRESCLIRIAEESEDSALCAALTHYIEKPRCYLRVAKAKTDPELCGAIETVSSVGKKFHDECVAYVTQETGGELRDEQLLLQRERVKHKLVEILESGDAGRCKELRNLTHKSDGETYHAKDQCYAVFARGQTQIERCDWQLEPVECAELSRRVARPKLCNQVDHNRDECYWRVAISTRDEALCEKVVELDPLYPKSRQKCYAMIAVVSGNEDGCRLVQDEELRSDCRVQAAEMKKELRMLGR